MTVKSLLPLIAATFICGGSILVEARQPKPTAVVVKPTVPKTVQPQWKVYTAPDGRLLF